MKTTMKVISITDWLDTCQSCGTKTIQKQNSINNCQGTIRNELHAASKYFQSNGELSSLFLLDAVCRGAR
jgi:hypothetical protein